MGFHENGDDGLSFWTQNTWKIETFVVYSISQILYSTFPFILFENADIV